MFLKMHLISIFYRAIVIENLSMIFVYRCRNEFLQGAIDRSAVNICRNDIYLTKLMLEFRFCS